MDMQVEPVAGRIGAEKAGGVGTLVIDNPARRNAMSFEMWRQMIAVLHDFERDDEVRCIVVRGEGGQAFCSGADISEFDALRSAPEAVRAYNEACEGAMDGLHALTKPTIAMIEGFCVGGGMALATSCDLRIAAKGSRYAIPAAKLGVGYDYPGIARLIDVVGASRAKEIFFTARLFEDREVAEMGFLNRLVERDELALIVGETARVIAGNAPLTIASVKLSIANALMDAEKRDLAACHAAELACFDSEDYAEGRRAFAEKRKPNFKGR